MSQSDEDTSLVDVGYFIAVLIVGIPVAIWMWFR
jgi:hypothetical protein